MSRELELFIKLYGVDSVTDEQIERFYKELFQLKEKEERVIRLKYGLDDGLPKTLKIIGEELNLTPQRIRQIELKAIRRLRHPWRRKRIFE